MLTSQLSLWSDAEDSHGWIVRESRRARRLMVRVFHTGRVEVVVPARTAPGAVERFVERHRPWIERKRAEARGRAMPFTSFPPTSIELRACGELWRLELSGGRRVYVAEAPDRVLVIGGEVSEGRALRAGLRRWLLSHADVVLGPMLAACARELGFEYQRLTIRRQRTRWGSCSTRGTISLNCCLLFQAPEVVRYLLIHELAHTVHMNHSRRFWQTVARHCPDYQRLDRELLDGWRHVPGWVFGEEVGLP